AADDWIVEHISSTDVCVTSDIPLASRCLNKGARVVSSTGKQWTQANIGNALVGREISRHLRELGTSTGGPAPITKNDRSRFLSARYGCAGCVTGGSPQLRAWSLRLVPRGRCRTREPLVAI